MSPPPPNPPKHFLFKTFISSFSVIKQLAGPSGVWRALFGVRNRRLCCFICVLVVLLSKSRRRCFAEDDGSVSGDGHRFRCCTVGELLRDSDLGVCDSR